MSSGGIDLNLGSPHYDETVWADVIEFDSLHVDNLANGNFMHDLQIDNWEGWASSRYPIGPYQAAPPQPVGPPVDHNSQSLYPVGPSHNPPQYGPSQWPELLWIPQRPIQQPIQQNTRSFAPIALAGLGLG